MAVTGADTIDVLRSRLAGLDGFSVTDERLALASSDLAGVWQPPPSGHFRLGDAVEHRRGVTGPASCSYRALTGVWDPSRSKLATAQPAVCAARLAAKLAAEAVIYGPSVAVDPAGVVWVLDGHHSLAMLLVAWRAGLIAAVPVYLHSTPGDVAVDPARLVCSCRA